MRNFSFGKLVAQLYGFTRVLFGFIVLPEVGIGLRQLGERKGELGIFGGCRFELLHGLEILALAGELQSRIVITQGRKGSGRRFEGLRLKFLHSASREIEFLADVGGQMIHRAQNIFFSRAWFSEGCAAPFQIFHRGIDANLIAEFCVLAPNNRIGVTEFRQALNGWIIQRGIG